MRKNDIEGDVVLIGAPNCGKTTLFNALTGLRQTVGNRPGVTVEEKRGRLRRSGSAHPVILGDLPGVYSLDGVTPDERVVTERLRDHPPDLAVCVIDSTRLERGLYPVLQAAAFGIPYLVVLTMIDEARRVGAVIDTEALSAQLGCRVRSVSAKTGEGISELAAALGQGEEGGLPPEELKLPRTPTERHRLCAEIARRCLRGGRGRRFSEGLDRLLLHRVLAFPIFLAILFLVYAVSVSTLGKLLSEQLTVLIAGERVQAAVRVFLRTHDVPEVIGSLVTEGIIGGVGTVVGFFPQFVLLFFFLSLLEESGYMSRAAVMTDRIFAAFGLSGGCCVPMIVGSGCSVPGILATRIIPDRREREIAVMTIPFIPCGAKLPVISLAAGCCFDGAMWVAPSVYLAGIASVFLSALLIGRRRGEERTIFVTELPVYRMPAFSSVLKSVAQRSAAFLRKAASVIFFANLMIWLLSSLCLSEGMLLMDCPAEQSLLASIGRLAAPLFAPLGFGFWEAAVATLMGLAAKEELAGVFGVIGSGAFLRASAPMTGLFTPASAYSFLLFNMLCIPCAAAVSAMRSELKGRGRLAFALGYQTLFAYGAALTVYQISQFCGGQGSAIGLAVAGLTTTAVLWRAGSVCRRLRGRK